MDPRSALALYRHAGRLNSKLSKGVFLTSLCTPLLAGVISFYVAENVRNYEWIATMLIVLLLGYGPPLSLRYYKLSKRKLPWYYIVVISLSLGFTFIISNAWQLHRAVIRSTAVFGLLSILGIYAYIITEGRILGWLKFWLPAHPTILVVIGVASIIFLVMIGFSLLMDLAVLLVDDLLIGPWSGLKTLAAGLWINRENVVGFIAGMTMGFLVVATGPFGLMYGNFYEGMLSYALSGLLLGLAISMFERDSEVTRLITFGCIRCNIRLGQWGFARVRLRHVWVEERERRLTGYMVKGGDVDKAYVGDPESRGYHLMHAITKIADFLQFAGQDQPDVEHDLNQAGLLGVFLFGGHQVRWHNALWLANIEATSLLATGQGVVSATRQYHMGRHCWSRIMDTGRSAYWALFGPLLLGLVGLWLGFQIGKNFGGYVGMGLGLLVGLRLIDFFVRVGRRMAEQMSMKQFKS